MILKSAIRATIAEVLEDHEIDEKDLKEDLVDRIAQDFGDEIMDDEDEAAGPAFLGDEG